MDELGSIYVTNGYVTNGVAVYEASGGVITQIPSGTSANPTAQIAYPAGLAVDKAGCLYVSDAGNNRVLAFSPAPTPLHEDRPVRPVAALTPVATCRLHPAR